ncbi:MAG TPA: UDP-N-acetylglucosamine--N-acetylmuramyl-(pentapeptide) pyrophosphoryl-undecaprenol N-acetylglucosamine transferase, partial [Opitutus sp.]|nr:UDP-N-acetylglucosamine--N-acetylmuramyl-(pentapeptide) pyrophosphoryl-undecaprenol N-acetylglucosamine transferase [Opitutus sp.]
GVPALPWAGQGLVTRGAALLRLVPAVVAARRRLREARVSALVGLGSFASFAPALAAWTLGIPVTLYEPNATLGLANRLLRKRARALLVGRLFGRERMTLGVVHEVGVPLRAEVRALATLSPAPPTEQLRLLVLGGSRGNPFLNERMPAVAACLQATAPRLSVTHQCGHDVAAEPIVSAYAAAGVAAAVASYLDPIAPHLGATDFVVSAAGAITLHELSAAAVPALVVPLDSGGGAHQQRNATTFRQLTGCTQVQPASWTAAVVAREITEICSDPARWKHQRTGLRTLFDADAAARFGRGFAN